MSETPDGAAQAHQATALAIGGRAVLIEGPPGSGKSSLALALIDRGAALIGDDGVCLFTREGALWARPHPATRGLIEVRNLGLLPVAELGFAHPGPLDDGAPVALRLRLDETAPRYVEQAPRTRLAGHDIPTLALWPGGLALPLRAELALARYGLRA